MFGHSQNLNHNNECLYRRWRRCESCACNPLRQGSRLLTAGPFNLGKFTYPIGILGIIWVCFITALFVLPTVSSSVNGFTIFCGEEKHVSPCNLTRVSVAAANPLRMHTLTPAARELIVSIPCVSGGA